jgi:DNA-binding XRE family transcriptional regulator
MLGNKVRAAMEEAEITNGQLAKLLGVTPQNVHKIQASQ